MSEHQVGRTRHRETVRLDPGLYLPVGRISQRVRQLTYPVYRMRNSFHENHYFDIICPWRAYKSD